MSSFHTFFGSACLVKKSREIEKKVSFHACCTKPIMRPKHLCSRTFQSLYVQRIGQSCVTLLCINISCGILKMVGPKKQDFWPKINIIKGNHCILRIRRAPVRQKLGMILENKVVQKLKLEKNVFYKKWSPKLIFLNVFF